MDQKIIRTGNSAAVTIPANFLKALNLKVGDRTQAKCNFDKEMVIYSFPDARQLRLADWPKTRKKK